MDISLSPNAPYAVLRVDKRKAKAMGAIAAASAHQLRQRPTSNADVHGPAPIIMHLAAGATPYQAACSLLDGAERRNKTTVLAREIVLSASASYFRPGREEHGGEFVVGRMKSWATAALAWAKRTWPDQLASFVLHLDEQNVHAHLICVAREKTADGRWKLNTKKFFDRERLRDLQTSYGEAMRPLGIRRGEPGSNAQHSEVKQFYGAVHRAKSGANRLPPPAAPKKPVINATALERHLAPILDAIGIDTEQKRQNDGYETARKKWLEQIKQHRADEEQRWQQLNALAAGAPLRRRTRSVQGRITRTAISNPEPTTSKPRMR
ncbi:MAG: plasmid recombination protein [Proteobacteria bacterium]|nr:plasmid recombination protein [Pseudomonadota bacterium]